MDDIESTIARLARAQHGNVTRAQLLAAGLSDRQIGQRAAVGRLLRRYWGVYAVSYFPAGPRSRGAAAVLACGPDAALSHSSGAALWEVGEWREPIEVTTPARHAHSRILVHRSSTLAPRDVTTHWGIRVTSPARTLYDIAPRHTRQELARFANDMKVRGFLRDGDLAEVLQRLPGRPGAAKLDPNATGYTRSGLERRFARFCSERGLPQPLTNAIVLGREVDAWFPEHDLIVELDTEDYHADPGSFERDRDNDATALAHGINTLRITGTRLDHHADREEKRLRKVMGI